MAAIVTDSFRRNNAQFFISDIAREGSKYYIALGKSDKWGLDEDSPNLDIPMPLGIPADDSDIKSNAITLIKINPTNTDLAIPHIKWKANLYYKAYDPTDTDCFYHSTRADGGEDNPCYAIVSGRIYLCLKRGVGSVTDTPISTDYRALSYGTDGYVWILIDNVSTATANINTDQFISITSGVASETVSPTIAADGGGLLYSFSVTSKGSGYTSNSVQFIARKANNTTVAINCPIITNPGTGEIEQVLLPAGYSYVSPDSKNIVDGHFMFDTVETGMGAVIVPNIAPLKGFAYKPSATLPSWFIGISVDAKDNISNDGLYIPYRQISVLKDVEYSSNASIETLSALRYLVTSSAPMNIPPLGSIIKFSDNDIKAYFDSYSAVTVGETIQHRIYFHQNSTTGYGKISNSGSFKTENSSTINYSSVNNGEYIPRSGEVIFAENRRPISRQSGQTEEIKIIIQF